MVSRGEEVSEFWAMACMRGAPGVPTNCRDSCGLLPSGS